MVRKPTYEELEERIKELEKEVDECKLTEQTLRKSEGRYRALFITNPIEAVIVDREGRVTEFNKARENRAKEKPSDRMPKLGDRMYTKDYAGKHKIDMRKELMSCIMSGQSKDFPGLKYNNTFLHINISPFNDGAIITSIDITDQKRAEEALRESDRKYRSLFEDSTDAIYMTTREGLFIDVNQSALDLFGYTREEMIGMNAKQIYVDPDDMREFQREIEEKGSVRHYEVKLRKKDGTEIYCLLSSSVRKAKDASSQGYQGIIHDVTEQRHLEDKLQQVQRMEAIGTLAGGIAHDFNNLLMGIQGNVSLMQMKMDSTDQHYERLTNIENQIQSGARLTSHLLGYARKGKYELKPVDLNQVVEETSETFGRTRKQITVHRELAEHVFTIEADPGQIEQVLLNLYVNAADAMPGGGKLVLKTMNINHKDIKGKLYDPIPGNYVMLAVTDTGTGMYKKTMERIFDPFFTTKERGHGTGLGLASAYGIIKSHGGYIDVESKRREGTTFTIYLPASSKEVRRVVKASEQFTKGTGTVLLVDDEEVILDLGRELLEAMGYQVLIAKNGKEAVRVYRKNQDVIDIVVLDMIMPNMGGGEAYDSMKKINPDVKVLLSSGFSIDGEATEILGRGCNSFIQKPFRMNKLAEKIREILYKK